MLISFRGGWLFQAMVCAVVYPMAAPGATFTVTTNADSGAGSLRQAILSANASAGSNTIKFQISGTPPFTITPLTPLPGVSNLVLIDGTTQPGFTGKPIVELSGSSAGSDAVGLELDAGFSTVRGLVINRFSAQGVLVVGASNVIQGNFIGTDPTGTAARSNSGYGIWALSPGNLIGGTNAGNGNVISGGKDAGVFIYNTNGNTIQGNLIGVTAAGTNALPNRGNGIVIFGGSETVVGGSSPGARNVISGNGASGIYLTGAGANNNRILGNYIGTDISGGVVVSNAADGITLINAPTNTIGGVQPGSGNVISGNGLAGVSLNYSGTFSNMILGNLIGTDVSGRLAFGNMAAGITISGATGNRVGGTSSGSGNVISGNVQDGIFLTGGATGNLIQGNLIGLSAAGTNAVHNSFNGISLNGALSNVIGGSMPGAGNVISGNASNGIGILSVGDTGNSISGNHIGTDVAGNKAVPNILAGIRIQGCSNVIGGAAGESGNVISGNGQQGIWLVGTGGNVTGNLVQGNVLGLNATGAGALGNGNAGVGISSAAGNQIGGTAPGARNLISANGDAGIFLIGTGASGNVIQGNFIGTDQAGSTARGNFYEGIYVQDVASNYIGGSATGAGNLISGNNSRGIWLANASWNVIQGNFIGTRADGTNALGNVFHGIDIDANATNNIIGGTVAGAGNRIAYAQTIYAGVRVRDGSMNNSISGNAIFDNGALGIDLGIYEDQSHLRL